MDHPTACPVCGQEGHRVRPATPAALLTSEALLRLSSAPLRFCATETCGVVYYGDESAERFHVGDLAVSVFQKSSDPDRLVCYCFEHSVSSIELEVATTGESRVPRAIAQKCRAGLDDCVRKNPQGRCCLGNVRTLVPPAPKQSWSKAGDGLSCCKLGDSVAVPASGCVSSKAPESE